MQPRRVLNFNNYSRLHEEEKEKKEQPKVVKTVGEIVSLFFNSYMFAVTKVPDYKDVLSDLLTISDDKDPAKRAENMEAIVKKISGKLPEKYASLKEDIAQISKSLKELYSQVASSEDAKKYLDQINTLVREKIVSYQEILQKQPLKEHKNLKAFESFSFPLLFEKNTFGDEREDLSKKMKSLYSEMISQQKSPSSEALKSRADEVVAKFDEFQKLLSDEEAWKKMKRRERKDKLESMNTEIDEIIKKTGELQISELTKIGVEKNIADRISSTITVLNNAQTKATEIEQKAIESAKGTDSKDSKSSTEYKVGDKVKYKKDNGEEAEGEIAKIDGDKFTFKDKDGKEFTKEKKDIIGKSEAKKDDAQVDVKDIKSGNVEKENMKKDGPNSAIIKKFQEDYNKLEIGDKIGEDGRYGNNTEKAVDKVAKLLKNVSGKDINSDSGKLLSADLQKSFKNFLDKKGGL